MATDVIAPPPSGPHAPPARCVHDMIALWCGWCLRRAEWAPLDLECGDSAAAGDVSAAEACSGCGAPLRTGRDAGDRADTDTVCWRCVE